jgi:Cytochrome P450
MSDLDPGRHIHKQKNIASAFLTSSIIKCESSVDEAITQLSNELAGFAGSGSTIDFSEWFLYFAFDVVGRLSFSKSFGLLEEGRDIGKSIAI